MDHLLDFDMHARKLSPSEGIGNTVTVIVNWITEEIQEDPVTGIQTIIQSNPENSLPYTMNFSISNTSHIHIRDLLLDRFMIDSCLSEFIAIRIASAASNLGFGINGFEIYMRVIVTHPRDSVVYSEFVLPRLVCEGKIDGEELKMETEPCSICLEGFKTSCVRTRMPCSHVFHVRCLREFCPQV